MISDNKKIEADFLTDIKRIRDFGTGVEIVSIKTKLRL